MIISVSVLEEYYNKIDTYKQPEELFGMFEFSSDIFSDIRKEYICLIKQYHPDIYVNESSYIVNLVNEIIKKINVLYDLALDKIKKNIYGELDTRFDAFNLIIGSNKIRVNEYIKSGDFADVYGGILTKDMIDLPIIVKIVRDVNDNDLLENEEYILKALNHKSLPKFYFSAKMKDNRKFNIIEKIAGKDLDILRKTKYKEGISVDNFVWIFLRLLSVIGYLHSHDPKINKIGVIHANIEPSNIIIRGYDHNVFLCDFMASVINEKNNKFKIFNEKYSAPEVSNKNQKPLPHVDMYSLGKSMIYLLGENKLPISIEHVIQFLIEEDYQKRLYDAWNLWELFTKLRKELFGIKNFTPFIT